MKKLFILIIVGLMIYGVYYGFTKLVEKEDKEVKKNMTIVDKIEKDETTTVIDTEIEAINNAYIPYCLTYVNSVEQKIALDLMVGNEIPNPITDINYVGSNRIPVEINLNITEKGLVSDGVITYDKVICKYENGQAKIEKR